MKRNLNKYLILGMILALVLFLIGCGGGDFSDDINEEKLSVRSFLSSGKVPNEIVLKHNYIDSPVGDILNLDIDVDPKDSSRSFVFASSESDIVEIDSEGTLRAKKAGSTLITIASKKNPLVFTTLRFKVTETFESLDIQTEEKTFDQAGLVINFPKDKVVLINKPNRIKFTSNGLTGLMFSGKRFKNKTLQEITDIKINRFNSRNNEVLSEETILINNQEATVLKVKTKNTLFYNAYFLLQVPNGETLFTNIKVIGTEDQEGQIKSYLESIINEMNKN